MRTPGRRLLAAAALAALLAPPRPARAGTSAGADVTSGDGYRGFDMKGALDLDKERTWEGDLSYSYARSKVGTDSRSNQVTGSLYHDLDDSRSLHGGLTHWRDSINDVAYTGPSLGGSYTVYAEGAAKRDSESEAWRATADADLFFYKAGSPAAPRTVRAGRRMIMVPGASAGVSLTQFHPFVGLEKPLFGAAVTPWLTAGHYFYSKDPTALENLAGRPRFAASAAAINGLVGGLLKDSGQVGLDARLPWDLRLTASLGANRLATDNTWATTQGLSAKQGYGDHLDASLAWSRTIQDGAPLDLVTAGATWTF